MPKCRFCNKRISPGTTSCPSCGAHIPGAATTKTDLDYEVRSLLAQGKKIQAIKIYRNQTGSSLKEAKDAIDTVERGGELPEPPTIDADLESEVLRLLSHDQKLEAVKLYKQRTGTDLMEARRAVEAIGARHGMAVQEAGCGAVALAIIIAVLTAIAAALSILGQ